LFEADEPDHVETVTGFADAKIAALMAHRSQLRSTMHIDDPASTQAVQTFHHQVLDRLAVDGALVSASQGEAFKVITDL
jgi:LmbE family N-acetylglucosaminyl deacetylase